MTKMATVKSIFSWMWAMAAGVTSFHGYMVTKVERQPVHLEASPALLMQPCNDATLQPCNPSIVIQPAIMRVGRAAAHAAFFVRPAHEVPEDVAHILLDLLRVFARFEAFDGDIEFLGDGAGRHDILHLAHHVGHVLWIVLVQMLHVALHFHHGALHARVIEIRHRRPAAFRLALCPRLLPPAGPWETAHLLGHLLVAALGADRQAVGLKPLR